MRVVVLGRNGAGSRSHYVMGYHGPGCIWPTYKAETCRCCKLLYIKKQI